MYDFTPYKIEPYTGLSYVKIGSKSVFIANLINHDGSRANVYGIIFGGVCITAKNGVSASTAISGFICE